MAETDSPDETRRPRTRRQPLPSAAFQAGPCAPTPQEGPAKQSLETSHTRLIITAGALFCLAFLVIGARLVEVAGFKAGDTRLARFHAVEKPETAAPTSSTATACCSPRR